MYVGYIFKSCLIFHISCNQFFSSFFSNKKAYILKHLIYFWFLHIIKKLNVQDLYHSKLPTNNLGIENFLQSHVCLNESYRKWDRMLKPFGLCPFLFLFRSPCFYLLRYIWDAFNKLNCRWCWNIFAHLPLLQRIGIKVKCQFPKTLHGSIHRYSILYLK